MKVIRLTESDLVRIVKRVISEQVVQGDVNDPWEYKKEGDNYYARKKGSQNWTITSGKVRDAISDRIFKQKVNKDQVTKQSITKQFCPIIRPDNPNKISDQSEMISYWTKKLGSDPYSFLNKKINEFAQYFISKGVPNRVSCELGFISLRPKFFGKNLFVIDTYLKLIFLFNEKKEFVAKDVIISGKNKQTNDAKAIAFLFMWQAEKIKEMGFVRNPKTGKFEKDGKQYSDDDLYDELNKRDARFLPAGVYSLDKPKTHTEYAGGLENVRHLKTLDGKLLNQALHGYYVEKPRTDAINMAKKVLSNPNDPNVSQEFLNLVASGGIKLNQSYGCINLTPRFMEYFKKYGENSFVFNVSEDKNYYYADNGFNFINNMVKSEDCPSPQSLGGEQINIA